MPTLYTMVAPCFFGTESTLNFEVKRLGAQNIQVTDGLTEGETILLFVPGKDIVRNGTPSSCEPDNSVCYDENGKEIR